MEEDEECGLGQAKLKVYGMHIHEDASKASSCVRRAQWRARDKM